MKADFKQNGEVLLVTITGDLDIHSAPKLKEALNGRLDNVMEVRFDLGGCDYTSSAGLRVLLGVYQILEDKDGRMVLVNVNKGFYEVLELTGFTDFIDIE